MRMSDHMWTCESCEEASLVDMMGHVVGMMGHGLFVWSAVGVLRFGKEKKM